MLVVLKTLSYWLPIAVGQCEPTGLLAVIMHKG